MSCFGFTQDSGRVPVTRDPRDTLITKMAAMISAINSTCGAEAEPAAEDAEAEAEAGGVHGRNYCSQFWDRGSEPSAL